MGELMMEDKIIDMIREINPYEDIDENTKLIDDGILDSLTLVLLISCIESEFGIKITEEKMNVANFETIQNIVSLIQNIKKNEA